ncbi:phosphatase PAP2 family protein [Roseateles sp.]|uniref:phosphatase PAP2 family protein n=1 Tax=Roseateles sp. TaxID=1971397 RepID=UPI0039EC7B73
MSSTPRTSRPGPARSGVLSEARSDALLAALALIALAVWEVSGLDLPLARLYGTAAGFAWRDQWLTASLFHDGARAIGWLFLALLLLSVWRPRLLVPELPRRERVQWILTTLLCVALIALLKRSSATSCPWSLVEFGGEAARYVPHWLLGVRDGGPGGCFPSGHASTAFSLLPGWFALRNHAPRAARVFLTVVLAVGLVLGWVQMMRGAHYLSHSLWTAWICWVVSAVTWHGAQAGRGLVQPMLSRSLP